MSPGEELHAAIVARGCPQAELARAIGVTPPFVTGVLNGRKRVPAGFAARCEVALDSPDLAVRMLTAQARIDADEALTALGLAALAGGAR